MLKKILSSALAVCMVFAAATALPEGVGSFGTQIEASAAEAKAPKNADELADYLFNATVQSKKLTFKKVKKMFDDLGFENYSVSSRKNDEGKTVKEMKVWWGNVMLKDGSYTRDAGIRSDRFHYCINDDNTASIIGYFGEIGELYIPYSIDGHKVKELRCAGCMVIGFDENDTLLGSGGGPGVGGDYYFSKKTPVKVYLPEDCTVGMPDEFGGPYYCIKGSASEKYLKENGFAYSYYTPSVKTAEVSVSDKTYTGKKLKPAVTVKLGDRTLKEGTNYTVTYKNNTKVGTATVTIKGKGAYKGTVKATFKICPKKTTLKKATSPKTKKLKVTYSKVKGVTGYQVTYSTSKKFTKKTTKSVNVKGASKTSKTISKLKKGKTYYVKVRSYKTVKGKTYYSGYSKVKKVKVK